MSDVIMNHPASIFPWQRHKKFAVRLRLKKKKQQSQQNPKLSQNGIVTTMLKQENRKFSKSIDDLSKLQADSLTLNFKSCLQTITSHHNSQIKYQNEIVYALVRRLKQNLKIFHGDYLITLTQNQKQKSRLAQSFQFTAASSGKLKVPEVIQKNLLPLNRYKDQFTSGNSSKIQQQQCPQQSQQQQSQKQKQKQKQKTKEYKQLVQAYTQLKTQVVQMQHYIQRLKQQLAQKQKNLQTISLKLEKVQIENERLLGLLDIKSSQYKILQEEIIGYEEKIQSLQQQIMELNTNNNSPNNSRNDNNSESDGGTSNRNPISQKLSKGLSIQMQLEKSQQHMESIKNLQKIYIKTQQTIKTNKILQKQKQNLQQQCQQLTNKIEQILNTIYDICDQDRQQIDIKNTQLKQIIRIVGQVLDQKLSIIQLQHNQRQNKLQAMIAEELDHTLSIISAIYSNKQQQGGISEQSTILDRLQCLRQRVQYIYLNISNKINSNSYFNILLELYGRIDTVIERSYQFGVDLEINRGTLAAISSVLEQQELEKTNIPIVGQNGNKLLSYLDQLQEMLISNQEYLTDDNVGYVHFYKLFCQQNGINVTKVQGYLAELQQILKQLYINQGKNANKQDSSKCLDILQSSQKIKTQNHQFYQKDIFLQQNTQKKLKQQATKLQRKYFPSNPQFIDAIINQLIQIRKINNEEGFLIIADNIFKAIKNRDEKFSQQMGRRKQVLKQRTAAISQICRKGIKDSSVDDNSFTKKQ